MKQVVTRVRDEESSQVREAGEFHNHGFLTQKKQPSDKISNAMMVLNYEEGAFGSSCSLSTLMELSSVLIFTGKAANAWYASQHGSVEKKKTTKESMTKEMSLEKEAQAHTSDDDDPDPELETDSGGLDRPKEDQNQWQGYFPKHLTKIIVLTSEEHALEDEVEHFFQQQVKGWTIISDLSVDVYCGEKCLAVLEQECHDDRQVDARTCRVMLFGSSALDYQLQHVNAMWKASKVFGHLLLFSKDALCCILRPGEHHVEPNFDLEQRWCSFIPVVEGPCDAVSTRGLKWDLFQEKLCFGGLISTRNVILGNTFTVKTSHALLLILTRV